MSRYEIAAYYFPQWHRDAHNERWHGEGWTEWELVKAAVPRYPGHRQPVLPAWGCFDEADPAQSVREIDLAADHGLTAFIYDTYWYEDGPFLHRALDEGFLKAPNRSRMKFALMWANHDWHNWHPIRLNENPWKDALLIDGRISRAGFERFTDKVIRDYFAQPNYLRIDGAAYYSIYDLEKFIQSAGGLDGATEWLRAFREKARAHGTGCIHLNGIVGRMGLAASPRQIVEALALDSVASYNWYDHYPIHNDTFPRGSYEKAMDANVAAWPSLAREYSVPFIPNVTTGWDSSPRCCATDRYENRGYPWLPVLEGNTPAAFEQALRAMKMHLDNGGATLPIFTINAWNEWTEGAFMLPDEHDGTARVEALKRVFGDGSDR